MGQINIYMTITMLYFLLIKNVAARREKKLKTKRILIKQHNFFHFIRVLKPHQHGQKHVLYKMFHTSSTE